jgi:phosphatidylglycerophosphate synthase
MSWFTEYKKSLKLFEVEEIFDLLFYRPMAFLVVKTVYRTNITPNHLTVTSILMGIIGGCMFSVGTPAFITVGALFYAAFNIFDCSDGQLSRLKNNGTPVGTIIDGIADFTATIAVYIGIAFGFANHQENPHFWWIMLLLTGLSNGIHGILVDFYRNRFLDYYKQRKINYDESLKVFRNAYIQAKHQKGKWFDRNVILIYLRYCALQKTLVARRKRFKTLSITPQKYYRRNWLLMRFWLLIGPTSQITNLIICSLFQRIDLFIWIVLFGFNGLALFLWIVQQVVDRTYKTTT